MQGTVQAQRLKARKLRGRIFEVVSILATLVAIVVLLLLLTDIIARGARALNWDFLNAFPSRFPEQAGIKSALWGSIWLLLLTAGFSFPIGVSAAIYLHEFAPRTRLTTIIQTNISNLAGVPSIIYGLLGLELFVRALQLERSLIAGALTMTLLVLPIIIVAAQEALRAVPDSMREASYALGATKIETIWHHVLPLALPGILTGNILALSRAIGETAPLITLGALTFVAFLPDSLSSPFTALPIQIFNWVSRPQAAFHERAAAAIIVLLALLLVMNAGAIFLRNRYQRRASW